MKFIVIAIISLLLTSCSATPVTHYYTLMAPTSESIANNKQTFDSIGIGPIVIPKNLSNVGIVSIADGNQLNVGLFDIWAGNLKDNITSVVANHLSQLLDHDKVWPFPWDNRHRPKMQLRIIFERFSGSLNENIVLQAKWTLLDDAGKKELLTKKINITKPTLSDGYNAYVTALNSALNEMTNTIAKEIIGIEHEQ